MGEIKNKKITYPLVQKAWKVDFNKIEEGFLYCAKICYADSRNQAKKILLKECLYDSVCLSGEKEEVTYLTIPVVRAKGLDKLQFEGQQISLYEIKRIIEERKRVKELNQILANVEVSHCYIAKRGLYYRPNSCGYTSMIEEAGVYEKKYAVNSAMNCEELTIIPIIIKEHNEMIHKKISELETKII